MAVSNSHITILTLNVNGLDEPIKRHRLANWIKSQNPSVCCIQETLQARREWKPVFNILKEKNFQPRISYPAKLSFISEEKIKSFANKQVLRDLVTIRPALPEFLKEALHIERNNQY